MVMVMRLLLCCTGLGMSCEVEQLHAPGATGFYDSAFHSKAATICDALTKGGYEFGFVHVKAVDDTGHDRMVAMKVGGRVRACVCVYVSAWPLIKSHTFTFMHVVAVITIPQCFPSVSQLVLLCM